MALNDTQVRQLRAKLEAKHVKTRKANGADLHYVEGWHVIAEANRIFGYDAWDRRTLASHCVWSGETGAYQGSGLHRQGPRQRPSRRYHHCAGGVRNWRRQSPNPGQAHDLALKGAETDATKRALATFGNPFGLALYDREQVGVRKTRGVSASLVSGLQAGPWVLRSRVGAPIASHDKPEDFVEALRRAMSDAHDIELLYDLWEQNIETLRILHRCINERPGIVPFWLDTYELAPSLLSSEPATQAPILRLRGTVACVQGSIRALSPSASRSEFAARSISALWQVSLV